MRIFLFAAAAVFLSVPAFAADPAEPVRKVMEVTVRNWSGEAQEWKYIFDEDMLTSLFSKAFGAQYREAAKNPVYEAEKGETGDPFGYDVVTNSQDGCPLEDLSITPAAVKTGPSDVTVRFRLWNCMDEPEIKAMVEELHFAVIEENGRPVIDDIQHNGEEGRDSLRKDMADIIAGE